MQPLPPSQVLDTCLTCIECSHIYMYMTSTVFVLDINRLAGVSDE